MRPIDGDAMFADIENSINKMTKIGIPVDGEYLWGKLLDALDNAPVLFADDLIPVGTWEEVWLDQQAAGVRPRTYYCSICRMAMPIKTLYCPHCGSKMFKTEVTDDA